VHPPVIWRQKMINVRGWILKKRRLCEKANISVHETLESALKDIYSSTEEYPKDDYFELKQIDLWLKEEGESDKVVLSR
jgi:hypothetical protein